MDLLFNLPEQKPGLHTPLIILNAAGSMLGILAESVRQIASPAMDSWLPLAPRNVFHDSAVASFAVDGRITHLLSAEGILLEQERSLVAACQVMAQQRLRHLEGVIE